MKEIWKDVVGYEGIYEVSSYGRIRTHKIKRLIPRNMVLDIGNNVI